VTGGCSRAHHPHTTTNPTHHTTTSTNSTSPQEPTSRNGIRDKKKRGAFFFSSRPSLHSLADETETETLHKQRPRRRRRKKKRNRRQPNTRDRHHLLEARRTHDRRLWDRRFHCDDDIDGHPSATAHAHTSPHRHRLRRRPRRLAGLALTERTADCCNNHAPRRNGARPDAAACCKR
jgi:hypothetical protein